MELEKDSTFDTSKEELTDTEILELAKELSEEPKKEETPKDSSSDMASIKKQLESGGDVRFTLKADKLYSEDASANKRSIYDTMAVHVRATDIPVTQTEKDSFLMAMLNDEVFKTTVSLMDDKVVIVCRDTNEYERQVALKAITNLVFDGKDTARIDPAIFAAAWQRMRMVMQVVSVNGSPVDYVRFDYAPNTYSDSALNQDAEVLIKSANELLFKLSAAKYSLYVQALDVFEHKINVLNESVLNKDFWNPAERG